ncbi:MAG: hypothetical protein JXR97_17275 [Planctomycetes bacterium]|nr:hypothetical protein [Planctomycetota bacterium]
MNLSFQDHQLAYMLAAAPLALVLALLTKRRRRKVVPCLAPWRKLLSLPRPAPKRNPVDMETILAFLIPLLAAAAIMNPSLEIEKEKGREIAVLIDSSLSMKSSGRIDGAAKWIDEIEKTEKGSALKLYLTGNNGAALPTDKLPRANNDFTVQRTRSISSCLGSLLQATQQDDTPVVFITDRATDESSPRLTQIIVGSPSENTAISAAKISEGKLFVAIRNYGRLKHNAELEINFKGGAKKEEKISITNFGADEAKSFAISIPQGAEEAEIFLSPADDLPDDNRTVVPLAPRMMNIDKTAHPKVALALEKMCGFVAGADKSTTAEIAVTNTVPAKMPTRGVLLIEPSEACCGIIDMKPASKARLFKIEDKSLPEVAIAGLTQPEVREALLPPGARVLAEVVTDGGEIPFAAEWEWEGKRVACLMAAPEEWKLNPAFAVMIAELADRIAPPPPPLPGVTESDNRMLTEATKDLPAIYAGKSGSSVYNLQKIMIALAALCALLLLWSECRRMLSMPKQPGVAE